MPVLAVTMPGKNAPYVCLEPWQGHARLSRMKPAASRTSPTTSPLGVGSAFTCGYRTRIL